MGRYVYEWSGLGKISRTRQRRCNGHRCGKLDKPPNIVDTQLHGCASNRQSFYFIFSRLCTFPNAIIALFPFEVSFHRQQFPAIHVYNWRYFATIAGPYMYDGTALNLHETAHYIMMYSEVWTHLAWLYKETWTRISIGIYTKCMNTKENEGSKLFIFGFPRGESNPRLLWISFWVFSFWASSFLNSHLLVTLGDQFVHIVGNIHLDGERGRITG